MYLTRVVDGTRRGGSGLHIGANLVLTADHCVDGVDHRVVTGGTEYRASVLVRSGTRDVDIAILRVDDLPPMPAMPCARIDRKHVGRLYDCRALGFPWWKKIASGHPELVEAPGSIPTVEGTNPQVSADTVPRMSLRITDSAVASMFLREGELKRSEWGGMSGAVVLTEHDQIVGVVNNHAQTEGVGSLGFTPLEALNKLPDAVAREFWSALSVSDYSSLPLLPNKVGVSSGDRLVGTPPGTPEEFVDRETLRKLSTVMDASSVAVVCAVTGMRGVGKTQLARAYAQLALDAGYDLVGWIDAETSESLQAGLLDVAKHVDRADPNGDPAKSVKALRSYLLSRDRGRWLLVFDNATEPDPLEGWLNRTGSLKVLVTTTSSAFTAHGPWVEVGTYSRAESVAFLAKRTGLSDDAGAYRVADELGNLPLALAVCAAMIRERRRNDPRYTYARYLERLSRQTLDTWLPRTGADGYRLSVWGALRLSLDETEAETGVPDRDATTRAILGLMAVLAPDGVTREMLTVLPVGEGVSAVEAADLLEDAIDRCGRQSVVTVSDDQSTLRMHGLMRRAVRERAEAAGDLATLARNANDLIRRHQLNDLEAWQHRARGNQVIAHIDEFWATGIVGKCDRDTAADAVAQRNWATRQLLGASDTQRALDYAKGVVDDAERLLGSDHRATLEARHNLARAYSANNSLKPAIALHEENLANYESILGHNDPATMDSRDCLANAYVDNDEFDKAILLHTENLGLRELAHGPDHRNTLTSRCNLSFAYRRGERKDPVSELVPMHEADLADRARVLGAHHPDTIESSVHLAYLYSKVGRLEDSIARYLSTLETAEKVLGPDHPTIREIRSSLATVYRDNGRFSDAIDLHKTVLDDAERTLGVDRRETLQSQRALAVTLRRSGRTDVLPLYEAAAADCVRVLGPDDPDTLEAQNNLATAYGAFGRLEEAAELYETTLGARERILGPQHRETRQSRGSLAWAYQQLGRHDEAIELYKAVVAQSVGATHAETLEAHNDLANAYRKVRRFSDAIELLESLVADRERTAGPKNPATLDSRNRLAVEYGDSRRFTQAIELYESTLEDREEILGSTHPDTIQSRSNLAITYRKAGRFAEAVTLYVAVVADRTRVHGPDHEDTLTSRYYLAYCTGLAGDPASAARQLTDLIADRTRIKGPNDEGTLRARNSLARWLSEVPEIVVWLEMLVAAHLVGRPSPNPDRSWVTGLVSRYPKDVLTSAVERRVRAAVDAQYPNHAVRFPPEDLAAHLVDRAKDVLAGQRIVCDGDETEWQTPDYLEYTDILSRSVRALFQHADPSEQFLGATEWLNLTTTWPLIAFDIRTTR